MDHTWKMLIGCLAAFALLFLLPALGLGEGVVLFGFLVAMFLCHLFMMFGHRHDDSNKKGGE